MALEHLERCDLCGSDQLQVIDPDARIEECLACGYLFDNPRPSTADIVKYYSTRGKYDSWLEELEGRDRLWRRRLSKICRYAPHGRLLDVGAGIGQFLFHAQNRFEVFGTEISEEAVRIAGDHFGIHLEKCVIEHSDAFLPETFDAITLIHVLEHVPSPSATIRRCRELLREGGFLFIAVPNDRYCFWRHGGLVKYCVKRAIAGAGVVRYSGLRRFERITLDPEIQTEIHLSHFTARTLHRFLVKGGFEVVVKSLDPYFSSCGFRRMREHIRFCFFNLINGVFAINLYETIWIVAKKNTGVECDTAARGPTASPILTKGGRG